MKIVDSSRLLIGQFRTILKSASCVIRVGEFRGLRSSSLRRLAMSCSSVIRIGGFQVLCSSGVFRSASSRFSVIRVGVFESLRDFRVSSLPFRDPSARQEEFIQVLCLTPNEDRLIGSPGVVSSRVPHHPAYGSVQGGSNQTRAFAPW